MREWTADELQRLSRMWASHVSASDIGRLLGGRSKCSIIGKARRMELPSRNPAFYRLKETKRMSAREIGGYGASIKRAQLARALKEKPVELPAQKPMPAASRQISLIDRTELQCAYVIGDANGPKTMMCGAPVEKHSLCAFHVGICRVPAPKKKEHVFASRGWKSAA